MIFRFILAILATYRLAQLVVFDDGPLFVFARLREWADIKAINEQVDKLGCSPKGPIFQQWSLDTQISKLREARGPMQSLNDGLHCPFCVGVWAAALCVPLVMFKTKVGDLFLYFMAIAGGQAIIERNSK